MGWKPTLFKEGNLAEYPNHEKIQTYSPTKLVCQPAPLLPVSLLALHHSSMVPPENPNSRSPDISVESWWAKSLRVLHRHISWWSSQPKEGKWSTYSAHTLPTGWVDNDSRVLEWLNFVRWTWNSACMDSEGGHGMTTPLNCLEYSWDNRWVWKRRKERTTTSDPHVLKQCAQRPQEVHLNCFAPAAPSVPQNCGKIVFFMSFLFLLPFKNVSWDIDVPDYFTSPQRKLVRGKYRG